MRPSAVCTKDGWLSPGDERFDPFWARVNEAGVTVVAHVESNGYTANGYGGNSALAVLGGGRKPSVAGLIPERAIYDFLLTFAYDKMFERFPNLRLASVENGSGFLRDLFVKLEQSKKRMPRYYGEDPAELFRRTTSGSTEDPAHQHGGPERAAARLVQRRYALVWCPHPGLASGQRPAAGRN